MDFLSSSPPRTLEGEMSRLRVENQALGEELAQCQADKEFVWSLWKRLQVASPDITQAVGMVIQREKEKAEVKDRKVLGILESKDDKIDDLQKTITGQSKELSMLMAKKVELQEEATRLEGDNTELRARLDRAMDRVNDLECRSKDREDISQEATKDMKKEMTELSALLRKREEDLERLKRDKTDLTIIKDTHKDRISNLERDLKEIGVNYDKLTKENHDLRQQIRKFEKDLEDTKRDIQHKNSELESVRKELSDLWETHTQTADHAHQQADLIKQLQDLHTDTQKMMQNQEDAYSFETSSLQSMYGEVTGRYQNLKSTELELRNLLRQYKQQIIQQETTIVDLRRQLDENQNRSVSTQASLGQEDKEIQAFGVEGEIQKQLNSMQAEISALRGKVHDKNKQLQLLRSGGTTSMPSPISSPRGQRSRSTTRSKSASPDRGDRKGTERRLQKTEKKLEDTRILLKMKAEELDELRNAHSKRLERLKSLQHNYRLVKKQLKIMEEEHNGPAKKRKKNVRSHPKTLQKEDSDTVWNELTHFKHQHKNLVIENMNLAEQVDTLKVQVIQDAATIHELRTCLEHEREELQFVIEQQQERSSTPEPDHIDDMQETRSQLDKLAGQLRRVQEEHRNVVREKESIAEERRRLRNEVNQVKQELAKQQIQDTNKKREILRLQRDLKKKKKKRHSRTEIGRQYQQILNKSIKEMSDMFHNFDKEGWEEVTESEMTRTTGPESTVTEVTGTTTSLGQTIMEHAQRVAPATTQTSPLHQSTPRRATGPATRGTSPGRAATRGTSPGRAATRGTSPSRAVLEARRLGAEKKHIKRITHKNESTDEDDSLSSYRDAAVSPIVWPTAKSHIVSKKVPWSSATGTRQMASYRQRIVTLQKEVMILKSAKNAANKRDRQQKSTIDQLQAELSSTSQRLQTARLTIQRLTGDIERLKLEKETLESQMDNSLDTSTNSSYEHQVATLQSKLRISTADVSKQLAQIKTLKAESLSQADKILQLQDRVSHLERDVNQKRTLVEDMKLKLKIAQENAQSDADIMLEVENKLQTLAETNSRFKTQIDSFRTRLNAVTKEKYENEEKVLKLSDELEKKTKQLSESQRKNGQLSGTVNELEKAAQQQMHALASESKVAINTVSSKLTTANARLQEFHKFIKILSHALISSIHQSRQQLQQKQNRKKKQDLQQEGATDPAPSLSKAHQMACDILNISQSDLEDLLSVKSDTSEENSKMNEDDKKDKRWTRKWEKLLKTKDEFSLNLAEIIMEKVNEKSELTSKLVEV